MRNVSDTMHLPKVKGLTERSFVLTNLLEVINISPGSSSKNHDASVSISAKWFHIYEKGAPNSPWLWITMMKDMLYLGAEVQYILRFWTNFSFLSWLRTMRFLMNSLTFPACRLLRKMLCLTWTSPFRFPLTAPHQWCLLGENLLV